MLNATQYEILERFAAGETVTGIADDMGMRTIDVSKIVEDKAKRSRTTARKLTDEQPRPALVAAKRAVASPLTAPIVKPAKKPDPQAEVKEYTEALLQAEPEKPAAYHAECARADCTWRMDGFASDRQARNALSDHVGFHGRKDALTAAKQGPVVKVSGGVDTAAWVPDIVLSPLTADGSLRPVAGDLDSMDALHLAALDIAETRDDAIALGNLAAALRSKVADHRRHAATRARIAELEAELAQLRESVAA